MRFTSLSKFTLVQDTITINIVLFTCNFSSTVSVTVVTSGTKILISWTSSGPEVNKYIVTWERDTSGECPDVDSGNDTIPGGSIGYLIENVEEDSKYFIVVKAISPVGRAVGLVVSRTTPEAGERLSKIIIIDTLSNTVLLYSSIWTSH